MLWFKKPISGEWKAKFHVSSTIGVTLLFLCLYCSPKLRKVTPYTSQCLTVQSMTHCPTWCAALKRTAPSCGEYARNETWWNKSWREGWASDEAAPNLFNEKMLNCRNHWFWLLLQQQRSPFSNINQNCFFLKTSRYELIIKWTKCVPILSMRTFHNMFAC